MEPHLEPLQLERLKRNDLILHSRHGVGRIWETNYYFGEPGVSVRFAGAAALFYGSQLKEIQHICTNSGPLQPLEDRMGYRPIEWIRYLQGWREGTLFLHQATEITDINLLLPEALLLHERLGISKILEFVTNEERKGLHVEFAHGWQHVFEFEELKRLKLISLDAASGRRPQLDEYKSDFPHSNREWDTFLRAERGHKKKSALTPEAANMPPRQISRAVIRQAIRHEVWKRDGGKCVSCGSREKLEFDHIVPFSKGGSDTARNIELLCESCNRKKGSRV